MYVYIYINFKAIHSVLDAKMVLKTHLFIKSICLLKVFRFLYRSFVSIICKESEISNKQMCF